MCSCLPPGEVGLHVTQKALGPVAIGKIARRVTSRLLIGMALARQGERQEDAEAEAPAPVEPATGVIRERVSRGWK